MTTKRRSTGSSRRGGRSSAAATTDHQMIRRWAEARGGVPSCVKGTGGKGDTGILRIDFPGYSGAGSLKKISWDEFFEKFDERNLALLHQDRTARGQKSNFNKLVKRGGSSRGQGTTRPSSSRSRGSSRSKSGHGRSAK